MLLDELARLRATTDADNEGITGLEVRGIETLALLVQFHGTFTPLLTKGQRTGHAN